MAKKTEITNKTYVLTLKNGDIRKITIPSNWKMTYGSVAPYQKGPGGYSDNTGKAYALRLYEGSKENLRAVFTDVMAIRDADIQVMEKRTSVKSQRAQKQTATGMKDVMVEARMTEWVNPDSEEADEVGTEFLKLPGTRTEED